jgi:hypothetical protein
VELEAIIVAEYKVAAAADKSTTDCFPSKDAPFSIGNKHALALNEGPILRVCRQLAIIPMIPPHFNNVLRLLYCGMHGLLLCYGFHFHEAMAQC